VEARERSYELWVELRLGQDRLYHPGPFTRDDADARAKRLTEASRGKNKFYVKAKVMPKVELPPFQSHAAESDLAYWQATNDGTLDWRRRDILHWLQTVEGAQTADDYYAAQDTITSGYGAQWTLLRRAGYIVRDGRKQTRSGSTAAAYRRGTRVVGPDFGDRGHFTAYTVPLRATIREAIIEIEKGDCEKARELLEDLVEME